jgi:hypothetical protein
MLGITGCTSEYPCTLFNKRRRRHDLISTVIMLSLGAQGTEDQHREYDQISAH